MKAKKKAIILGVICLVVLVGAIIGDMILGKSYFKEIKFEDVIEKMDNKETFILLVSQTYCDHCKSYKPKIEDVANEYKIPVYYIDVDLLNEEDSKTFSTYISYTGTPVTVFIVDGTEKTAAARINGDASREKIIKKFKSNGFISE